MKRLIEFANAYKTGLHEIKLKELLQMLTPEMAQSNIQTKFPPVEIGSITLVDQIVLLILTKLVNPKTLVEVGTFQGYTTRLLLDNTIQSRVISIDLPLAQTENLQNEFDEQKVLQEGDYNDDFLRAKQRKTGEIYLTDLSKEQAARLKLIKQDSTKLSFKEAIGEFEYIFIDGGHHYEIVKHDTQNALSTIKNGVIIWHDYASNIHSDVTEYLNELAQEKTIFSVKGSLCAFSIVQTPI